MFNIFSHLFALLPIYVAFRDNTIIGIVITTTTIISTAYHIQEYRDLQHTFLQSFDRLLSSVLIITVVLVYIDHINWTVPLAAFVTFFVIILRPQFLFVYVACVVAVCLLVAYQKHAAINRSKSIITVSIAAGFFFFWDVPYAHCLWHIFAFTTLALVLPSKTPELYWGASIPSRFFIAWILIDWDSAESLWVTMLIALAITPVIWIQRDNYTSLGTLIVVVTYIFILPHNLCVTGIILILMTCYSIYSRYHTKHDNAMFVALMGSIAIYSLSLYMVGETKGYAGILLVAVGVVLAATVHVNMYPNVTPINTMYVNIYATNAQTKDHQSQQVGGQTIS